MLDKVIQTEKAKRTKRNEEIANLKAEWDARSLWDRVKQPAILSVALAFGGLVLLPQSETIGHFLFYGAVFCAVMSVAFALGARPLTSKELEENRNDHTDPACSYMIGNVFNRNRWDD